MKPDEGYIMYIQNPKCGASSNKYISRRFTDYLAEKGYKVKMNLTESLEHACELATDAAVDFDCGMVMAAGGDGTVREVAHGLEGSDKPLMIVPSGTENLLANELGFDIRLGTVISAFEGGYVRPLDLGDANGKYFTSIMGFGFDGQVVRRVAARRAGHISHLDYFEPIWRTFWNYKFGEVKVEVDGEELYEGPGLVFVGNISHYAIGLHILRKADCSDGLLDVCIYRCASKLHLVKHSVLTVLKKHEYGSDVVYKQGTSIKVSSEAANMYSEMDGDPGPELPVSIEVVPGAVKCIVPEGAKPAGVLTRIIRALG